MPNRDKRKRRSKSIVKSIIKRTIHPRHMLQAIKLQRARKRTERVYDDAELALYGHVFPGGFLHYGYFDDPDFPPEDLSFNVIGRAQQRHAELILDQIVDRESPILDVGCGMGGLSRLMVERGLHPVALSPDRHQLRHIREAMPDLPVIEGRFEDIDAAEHAGRFGTIITSESLQYLDLDEALPLLAQLLKPGGRWIAYDYFRIAESRSRSGHRWAEFETQVLQAGWTFVSQQDHTLHMLPMLRFLYRAGHDVGKPLLNFAFSKLQQKQPAIHYLLHDTLALAHEKLDKNLDMINPDTFVATRKYLLLVLERAG